jgi:hypothetical protein
VIVRISTGHFPADAFDEVERVLAASEASLRTPISALPGLIRYFAGIDRTAGRVVNVSVWDSIEHARAMDDLAAMRAQRPILQAAGVTFEPVANHQTVWTITP